MQRPKEETMIRKYWNRASLLLHWGARVALVCWLALGFAGWSQGAGLTTFAVPWGDIHNGAPVVINASGVIAGTYIAPQPCPCVHAFVRAANDTFTSFDVPDAFYTYVESMNASGAIAGFYKPSDSNLNRSFIRSADGLSIIGFDPVPGQPIDTINSYAQSINTAGVVVGFFSDYSVSLPRPTHSYVRAADGTITVFDVPNAPETYALSINDSGVITGYYRDASNIAHGFVRASDGTISTFDAKNSPGVSTVALGVSSSGDIVGSYVDPALGQHGFIRTSDGKIDRFDVLHASWTVPVNMSPSGIVVGWYQDATGDHGFVREAGKNGKITTFNVSLGLGGHASTIADDGTIAGWYFESANVTKGFFGKP